MVNCIVSCIVRWMSWLNIQPLWDFITREWESGMHVIGALMRKSCQIFTAVYVSCVKVITVSTLSSLLHHFFPREKMKIFSWISCILVAAVAAVAAEDAKVPPTELQIETTFKPEKCVTQAKVRDYIHVHYVSRFKRRDRKYLL